MLRRGSNGTAVVSLRAALTSVGLLPATVPATDDAAVFDEDVDAAVRAFQQGRGLIVDGIVGPATEAELMAARWKLGDRTLSYTLSAPMSGDDIAELQQRLAELGYDAGRPDGIFAAELDGAVRQFQQQRGLPADGVFGPVTFRELLRLTPMATGGRPLYLREIERVRQAGPLLGGKRVVLDPAGGGADKGVVVAGHSGSEISFDLARRVEARFTATGMQAFLTRGMRNNPTPADRAALANEVGADLLLSVHIDGSDSPHAAGIATVHFGTETGNISSAGEALAQLVHRELIARTGMIDCRVHYRPWEILRLTQMPAVQVELGYLTNPTDRARLLDDGFRDQVADALVIAVKRLYLDGRDDRPTGTFTFADLLEYERAVQSL